MTIMDGIDIRMKRLKVLDAKINPKNETTSGSNSANTGENNNILGSVYENNEENKYVLK